MSIRQSSFRWAGQAFRFGIVGALATVTHMVVLVTLVELGGLHPTLSTAVAFTVAVLTSFQLNRSWTFASRGRRITQLPRFVLIQILGLLLNTGIMTLVYDVLHWHYLTALALWVLVVPPVTFVLQRYWTFRPQG